MTGFAKIDCLEVPEPPGASWSNGLVIGREIVLSGVTARASDGKAIGGASMEAQTRACFDKVVAQVKAAGGHPGNIYRLVIYVTDIARKDEVNAARKAAFAATYPVSTLVEVSGLVFPDLLVEVDAFANLDVSLQQD